jgi:glyoxylase-like metal-dependent hydrolase (beta-lactamase superfamily II)
VELIKNKIYKYKNTIFPSNTYFYKTGIGNNCLIIDPGLDTDNLIHNVDEIGLLPVGIIATHGHFDHIGSAEYFQKKFKAPLFIHGYDLKLVKTANFYLKIAKINYQINTPIPDNIFEQDKYEFKIDGVTIMIHHTPGHSEGSCVIRINKFLFSGDTLYKNGIGFNNFPGENKEKLKTSIKNLFINFNEELLVFPGHGDYDFLKNIKTNNKELINFLES